MSAPNSPAADNGTDTATRSGVAISLAIKVALPIGVGAAAIAFLLWTWATDESADEIWREFDVAGALAVEALALPDAESWEATRGTLMETAERVVEAAPEFGDLLSVRYGIIVMPVPDTKRRKELSPEFVAQQEVALDAHAAARQANRGRLAKLLEYATPRGDAARTRVLDAYVLREENGRTVVRASDDGDAFAGEADTRTFEVERDGVVTTTAVTIRDGVVAGEPARAYERPIVGADGAVRYRVFLALSTREVRELVAAMKDRRWVLAALVAGLAWAAVFLVTRVVTAPLRRLQADASAVAAGDLQHRTSVKTDDEIGLLARTMDTMVRRLDHALAEHDDQVAEELNRRLVASEIPVVPGFEVSVMPLLTRAVGGAYYDVLELPEGKIGLVVAEASSRGVSAAVNVCMAGALIRAEARDTGDPAEILRRIEVDLRRTFHAEMKMKLAIAILDPARHSVTLCSAGGMPISIHRGGDEVEVVGAAASRDVELRPGDRLVLANTGVTRIANAKGDALGEERWRALASKVAEAPAERFDDELRQLIRGYAGKRAIEDDVVVVSLRVPT